ncbi:MAG: ABC transporter permease [Peptococcaceae bacterium]|jgi:ABC-type antimicrobial peptide transport system permease subunit|nr:ABC transporter permease [Peptococcaceae bacterium]
MNKLDILVLAYRNLWRRKVRAVLTILGVLIGTMAIVVMISIGVGLDQAQRKMFESWGNLNMVTVNQGRSYNYDTGEMIGEEQFLDDEAVTAMEGYPGVMVVAPVYQISSEAKFGKMQGYINIYGMEPSKMEAMELKILEGRMLTDLDRNMMVVGYQVRSNFYDPKAAYNPRFDYRSQNSLEMNGKLVTVNLNKYDDKTGQSTTKRQSAQIIGVLEGEYSDTAWNAYASLEDVRRWRKYVNANNGGGYAVYDMGGERVMSSTRSSDARRKKAADQYDNIMIRCKDVSAARQVCKILREQGYNVYTLADQLEGIESQSLMIQAVLGGIGAITLLVASIGIANTMIMSIYERTREIGVMKVVGANGGDVQALFLMEAGLIGVFGGMVGLAVSYGLSRVINYFAAGSFMTIGEEAMDVSVIPFWLAIFALVFAFFIGIVAGWFPARRATRLSPITAIRNE